MELSNTELKYLLSEAANNLLTEVSNNAIETIIKTSYPRLYKYFNITLNKCAELSQEEPICNIDGLDEDTILKNPNMKLKDYLRLRILELFRINRGNGPVKYIRGIFRLCCGPEIDIYGEMVHDVNGMYRNNLRQLVNMVSFIHENNLDFDENLNGLSVLELHKSLWKSMRTKRIISNLKTRDVNVSSQDNDYTVIKINTQKQAAKYAKYNNWCITYSAHNWELYTQDGSQFYFCLQKGFEDIPKIEGRKCPLDEYGLSMVSVLVSYDGSIKLITTRWNHENNGENPKGLTTAADIQRVLGLPADIFKPSEGDYEEDIITEEDIPHLLADPDIDINDIFDEVDYEFFEEPEYRDIYLVKLRGYCNLLRGRKLLSENKWFLFIHNRFTNGWCMVEVAFDEYTLINTEGKLISNDTYEWVGQMNEGCAIVEKDLGYNLLKTDGTYVLNQWVDFLGRMRNGWSTIKHNKKKNYINITGELMFGDDINLEINKGFFDGYAVVKMNGQWNLINPKGEFLFDSDVQEIRFISSFCKGYCCITLNNGEKYALDTNLQWHTTEEVLEANPELEIATYVDENTDEKYYQFQVK